MTGKEKIRRLSGRYWSETSDNDPLVLNELEGLNLKRYYKPSNADWLERRTQRMLLRYLTGKGILFWKRQPFLPNKTGIRCMFLINNSERQSIELLRDAIEIAKIFWVDSPFFVHINPKLFPKNAEQIFKQLGWKFQGRSKENYPIYRQNDD